jgi:uncharacterized damage-inducible protein DinB
MIYHSLLLNIITFFSLNWLWHLLQVVLKWIFSTEFTIKGEIIVTMWTIRNFTNPFLNKFAKNNCFNNCISFSFFH